MLTIEEIGRIVSDDASNETKKAAKVGRRYYEGDHDILGYKLFYYDADGVLVEDKARSNIKIPHPFFTELVDQCVQYMTSGDGPIVRAKDDNNAELQTALDKYFGDEFMAELSETLTDACSCGFGYMHGALGSDLRTHFTSAEALGVVEVRAKDVDANAEHYVYWYVDRIDRGRKKIKRIQVWDEQEVSYYVKADNGQIAVDKDEPLNPRPHIVYKKGDERFGKGYGFIPFFRLDANQRRTSHLKPVKRLIDDYDLMSCGLSNNVQDVSEAIYVVKGFDGENLDEMIQNLRTKKSVKVDSDGGVELLTTDIPYDARMKKLEVDEKNIYRFGMGLNASQVGDGNVTNVVIKSRYALLDMKCNKLETRLKAFMRKLVGIALEEINASGEKERGYTLSDVDIRFEREVMTNAKDNAEISLLEAQTKQAEVGTLLNAASVYGDESVLNSVCELLGLEPDEVRGSMPEEENGGLDGAVAALTGVE